MVKIIDEIVSLIKNVKLSNILGLIQMSNYYHEGEQLTFLKKYYISKHSGWEKKNDFVIFVIAINSKLLDKNRTQDKVKCHIQHERSWLRWIVTEQLNYE